jgi:uncharacterized damage-inducible protein DinB
MRGNRFGYTTIERNRFLAAASKTAWTISWERSDDVNAVLSVAESSTAEIGIEPLVGVLGQLRDLLEGCRDEQYSIKPVGVVPSSIGGHVRHCLDHITALLNGVHVGQMTYDHRPGGTVIESDRSAAIAAIDDLNDTLGAMNDTALDQPIRLSVLMSPNGPPALVETSLGRELAFVISHTIHHNALVGVIAKLLGVPVPDRFGYAPSTLARMRNCAGDS